MGSMVTSSTWLNRSEHPINSILEFSVYDDSKERITRESQADVQG